MGSFYGARRAFSIVFHSRRFHYQDRIIASSCFKHSSFGFSSSSNNGSDDVYKKAIDFTKINAKLLPTVMPNVGKRRDTPDDHVTTANVLARTQFAVLIIDMRAPQIKPIVFMNKSESIGSLDEVASEALALGFGEPIAISAETGLGMTTLYEEVLRPQGRTVYLVDTAGWLERTERDKGPASLSIMQSRKSLMRAHVIALVLDAKEIIKARCSMTHAEVVIARRAVEEGRGLVVIVNKMDRLRGKENSEMYKCACAANVLARTQFAVLIIDVRAPQIKPVMNTSESIGSLDEVASEALALGFGDPIAISAETGLGMTTLYEDVLRPLLEDYMVNMLNGESKLPLQLAIVGKPNVGKSTLLNALLEEERVLVGPEAGLTRDAVENQRWCSRLSTGRLNPWFKQRARGFTTKAGKDHESFCSGGGYERWTDILVRAFSGRLEKYLKNKCKKDSNFAAKVLKAMQNVQRFKRAIMSVCTGEEEPHKEYDADSAAKGLARLLGPATIAVLVFLFKQMFGAVQEMLKQRRMKNEFDTELQERQEKILQSANENLTKRAKEITEEIEKMKKSHKEEIEALKWLTLHLSRRK